MATTAPFGPHSPRLSSAGYERVFAVLEHCEHARSLGQLKELIVEALPATFHFAFATFFQGNSLESTFYDPDPVVPGGQRERRMLAEYQDRWRSTDVYSTPNASELLARRGVAALRRLDGLPPQSLAYVRDFLAPRGLVGSAALALRLPAGGVGLVGLFDPDPRRFADEDLRSLQLVARHLSTFTRLLPEVDVDILQGVRGGQREVAALVGEGLSNAEIGARLHLAEDTVKKYVSRVLAATGCRSRTELAVRLSQNRR